MSRRAPTTQATSLEPYGPSARIYDRLLGQRIVDEVLPVLDELLLRHLPAGVAVLDVCCGTGRVSQALAERGFKVTGLDLDPEMLVLALDNAPACRLLRADVREFVLAPVFAGALATSDCFNHLLSLAEVEKAFANVHDALVPGGLLCFDVLLLGEFQGRTKPWQSMVADDFVQLWSQQLDVEARRFGGQGTLFYRQDGWRRWDTSYSSQLYTAEEIEGTLTAVGFTAVRMLAAAGDLGRSELADRTYVVAERSRRE